MKRAQSPTNKKKDGKKLKKNSPYQATLTTEQATFSFQSEKPIDCTLYTNGMTFQIKQPKKQNVGTRVINIPLNLSEETTPNSPQQEPSTSSEIVINQPTTPPVQTGSESIINQLTESKEVENPLSSFKEPSFEAPKPQRKRIIIVVDHKSGVKTYFEVTDGMRISKVMKKILEKDPCDCRFVEDGNCLRGDELVGSFFKDYPEDNEVIIDKIMNCSGA